MSSPIVIGVDGWYLGTGRGIGNYQRSLLRAMAETVPDVRLIIYTPAPAERSWSELGCTVRTLGRFPYPIWEQVILPRAASADRLNVLHCMANTGPVRWRGSGRLVMTVHDVMFLHRVSEARRGVPLYQRVGASYRRIVVPRAGRRAAAVITDSEYSRRQIINWMSPPESRVHVIPCAADRAFRQLDPAEARQEQPAGLPDDPFILALGASDPRKNTVGVIKAFHQFQLNGGGEWLVIAGVDKETASRLTRLCQDRGVDRVVVLGFVTSAELVALYNLARVFVYPSFDEGFGFPVLEAMACGVPVITSNRSSLPEVAGDAACLVSPRDIRQIAAALERLARANSERQILVRRGLSRARDFSWGRAAQATIEVYRSTLTSYA